MCKHAASCWTYMICNIYKAYGQSSCINESSFTSWFTHGHRRSQVWIFVLMVNSNRSHHCLMISIEMEGLRFTVWTSFFRSKLHGMIPRGWIQNVGLPNADKGRELGVDLPSTTSGSRGDGGCRGDISACRQSSCCFLLLLHIAVILTLVQLHYTSI